MTPQLPIVLVVDDAAVNVQILADALRDEYQVKVASNGKDALKIAERDPQPDLILLDVMMPEMDGFEVCRRLKNQPNTEKIPVIFVTAKNQEVDEEIGLNLGAIDYITKPYSIPVTRARVRNHVRLKKQADQLELTSMIDALTGVANRRRFDEAIEAECKRAVREATCLSVLMLDIDHFKEYNDHYGHGAGDGCLRTVAMTLAASVSRPTDLVTRYGGEEFVVILPDTDREAALMIAERMRQKISDLKLQHEFSSCAPVVTVSVGGMTLPAGSEKVSATDVMDVTDKMLYQAKGSGRNRVCFSE